MKCVYEITTKYFDGETTARNFAKYRIIAENLHDALGKIETCLKNEDAVAMERVDIIAGEESVDNIIFLFEIDI